MTRRRGALLAGAAALCAALALTRGGLGDADDTVAGTPDAETAAALEALGYATWSDARADPSVTGVTRHDPQRAFAGIGYYCSEPTGTAHFVDMRGDVIWTIEDPSPLKEMLPGNRCKLIEPYDADSVLMVVERTYLTRLALDSKALWSRSGGYHHDVAVAPDGTIYAIRDRVGVVPFVSHRRALRDTEIVAFSPEGEEIRTWSVVGMLLTEPLAIASVQRVLAAAPGQAPVDVFHTNSITVVDRELPLPGGRRTRPGQLLVVLNRIDTLAVIDPESERIVWTWGQGELEYPHDASLTPGGNVLVFDNGSRRGYSRVLEVEPASGRIVWEYAAQPKRAFFSNTRGGAQSLPNGNVLITDSEAGRVFEVTRAGEVVWEFWNPRLERREESGEERIRRATIFRMNRLAPESLARLHFPSDVLERLRERGYRR